MQFEHEVNLTREVSALLRLGPLKAMGPLSMSRNARTDNFLSVDKKLDKLRIECEIGMRLLLRKGTRLVIVDSVG